VAWLLYLSALNCSAQKKFVDAERLFKRSIAVYEKLSGGHDTAAIADVYSQQTASALGCLAQNCVKQAKYTEAKSFFQRELAILESLKPTNNAAILAIKQALTQIEDKQHSAPARRI
jgi:hypothetical protein